MTIGFIQRKIKIRIIGFILNCCYILKLKKLPVLPIWLDIEPTNRCNYNCLHCQSSYWKKEKKDLAMNSFIKILNQFPYVNFVKLQGIGEPFLNPELTDMLLLLEERKINSTIFSNGSVIPDRFLELAKSLKRLSLKFSIDGPDEETQQKTRPGCNYSKIKGNITRVIQRRGQSKREETSIWTVVTKNNLQKLNAIIDLAAQLDVKKIYFQLFLNNWAKIEIKEYNKKIRIDIHSNGFKQKLRDAKSYSIKSGVELQFIWNHYLTKKNKCKWPYMNTFIASNGDVVPCCVLSDSNTIKMGNLFEEDFRKIWNSQKYQEFRRRIKKHDLYDFCKQCYQEEYEI